MKPILEKNIESFALILSISVGAVLGIVILLYEPSGKQLLGYILILIASIFTTISLFITLVMAKNGTVQDKKII